MNYNIVFYLIIYCESSPRCPKRLSALGHLQSTSDHPQRRVPHSLVLYNKSFVELPQLYSYAILVMINLTSTTALFTMLCNRSVTGYDRSTCDFYYYGMNKLCLKCTVCGCSVVISLRRHVVVKEPLLSSANALALAPDPARWTPRLTARIQISYYPRN